MAIDFETANHRRDSACAVGLVRVHRGEIAARGYWLIRPPTRHFTFSWLHGIRWEDVRTAPNFAELWPELAGWLSPGTHLAAHNAAFDMSVLRACCERYGIDPPAVRQVCTLRAARSLRLRPASLDAVCRQLGIPLLRHHDALCDAEACARIVLELTARGARVLPQ